MKGPPSPPSLPIPYSVMWLAHEYQTTWQNIWKWIQGNLEIYSILEGGIDTSPVEKNYTPY